MSIRHRCGGLRGLLQDSKAGKPGATEWRRRNKTQPALWTKWCCVRGNAGEPRLLDSHARSRSEASRASPATGAENGALGHHTGGIAHKFSTIFSSIMVLRVLRPIVDEAPATRPPRSISSRRTLTASAAGSHPLMLTFSRGQRGQPRRCRCRRCARRGKAVRFPRSHRRSKSRASTRATSRPSSPSVHLDHILLNLCLNARDAMGGAGGCG